MNRPLDWTVVATAVPASGSLGGVVRYTTELLRGLATREDVRVSAVTTRAAVEVVREMVGPGHVVREVPNAPVPLLALAERGAPLPGLRRGDVVHGVKHLVPRSTLALRVLTVHDMLLLDRPGDFGGLKRRLLPGPYRRSLADADLLVCVSEATRQRVLAHVPSTTGRSAVVHLATSEKLRGAAPREIPALQGKCFALVVGDTSTRKNLATVIAAWESVRRTRPDAVLAMAGPPEWGRTSVGEAYARLVEKGAVVPLGHVTDDELRWAYDHAAVVLCPSLAEGFGLPAAEALALGAPVVVSDDAALVEVAAGRQVATLPARDTAAWASTCVDVLGGPSTRRRPAPARTWQDVTDETVHIVRDAVDRRCRDR